MIRYVVTGLLASIVLVIGLLATLVYGPALESSLRPVVSISVSEQRLTEDRLYFTLSGDKFRDCRLETALFAWHFGGQLLPTELYYALNDKIFNPTSAAYSVSDPPYHVRVYAILSRPIYGVPTAELSGVAYYRCHPLWLLHYDFAVQFVPPPSDDVVPRRSPIAPN